MAMRRSMATLAARRPNFARLGDGVYRFSGGGSGAASSAATRGVNVTVMGGVHGNERIGVAVLDSLRLALLHAHGAASPSGAGVPIVRDSASVTLVYANERALRVGKRGSEPHADLNRCFSSDILLAGRKNQGSGELYEHARARQLAPLLVETDVLVDLHSTNKPSPPFLRIAGHRASSGGIPKQLLQIATRMPCDILLHDPQYLLADGHVALTDEFVGASGGLGLCFESGVATDVSPAKVDSITRSIWDILVHDTRVVRFQSAHQVTGLTRTNHTSVHSLGEVYEITQVFKLTAAGFRWADGVGDTNFQHVAAHQPIGFVGHGDATKAFVVDYESFIVFPKVPELWKVGAPLGWLTKKVNL